LLFSGTRTLDFTNGQLSVFLDGGLGQVVIEYALLCSFADLITDITPVGSSTCNITSPIGGFPENLSYSQDVEVTYSNAPAGTTLCVNGQPFPLTNNSPQTVTLTNLPNDGTSVSLEAGFGNATCTSINCLYMDDDEFTINLPPAPTVDNAVLEYCALPNPTQPDISSLPIAIATGDAGVSRFIWYYDNAGVPTTLPSNDGNITGDTFNPGEASTDLLIAGNYTVYVVQIVDDCISAPTSVELIVNELPDASFISNQFCAGEDLVAVVNNPSGSYTYTWLSAVTLPANPSDSIIVNPQQGDYILMVTNNKGCSTVITTVVTLSPKPEITIENQLPIAYCIGSSTTIDVTTTNGNCH